MGAVIYDTPQDAWWREQYTNPSPMATSWIARWPQLVRCRKCSKQLGHDEATGKSSTHLCLRGLPYIGGRLVDEQPQVEPITNTKDMT